MIAHGTFSLKSAEYNLKNLKMKKLLYITLIAFGIGLFASSCYDDDSTLDVNAIPDITLDTTGVATLTVYQFENLKVIPELDHQGLSESELEYEWKINLEPNDTIYEVVGNERDLDFLVEFKPNLSGNFHQLVYTVTNTRTNLDHIFAWPVKVLNNIGEGLVVAHTEDGATTDISHIMSPSVTPDYEDVSVKHNVYSAINGSTIPGITKQMRYTKLGRDDVMFGITETSIYTINTLDYTFGGSNGDLFYAERSNYEPQALGGVNQGDLYLANGTITSTYLGASTKIGLPFDSDFTAPDIIAANGVSNPIVVISFYDEVNGQFVYQPSVTPFGDNTMYATPNSPSGAFDPTTQPGYVNLAAGVSTTGEFMHLLKNNGTGEVALFTFDEGVSGFPTPEAPKPIAKFDLTGAPGIDEAENFAFLDDQKVMYYATSTKVYAVLYGTATPTIEERYTVPSGETITTLQVYRQADYPVRFSGEYMPLNNKALIMSTFDDTTGRVYLLPYINTGIGNIDTPNIEIFSGFGKITAIATQL